MMLAAPQAAGAMTFTTETSRQGLRMVMASGPVQAGDAERLRQALLSADRDPAGNKLLVLDSPGGPIGVAFEMAAVMEEVHVSTEVRSGASCASSCAMILFVSGRSRTLQEGGWLGIHTCYDGATKTRSMACNELIAQNAARQGVPYGSIVALLHLTAPGEMRWLDAHAAQCWSLVRNAETAQAARPPSDPASCLPPASPATAGPPGQERGRVAAPRN
ncbi:hypothetical protein BH11PSE3_BH11PSE3_39890 [soil metagenome]